MKIMITIIRLIVGILFIISGVVKANDPLGLSYKMQEFFEVWNAGLLQSNFFLKGALIHLFNALHEHSLALSVSMIALEIMAGVALLAGWKKKWVLNLLMVLIVFFTFLTAYAYLSGKFKNCGCFGDCLPITPLTSFLKDLVLLVLIVLLAIFHRYIRPAFTYAARNSLLVFALLFSIGFQWYVLNYLPVVDCLPFKKGKNIAEQMKMPAGAVPDSFAIRFVYEKEGKKYEFSPDQLPADLGTYTFVDRTDKLIRKGNAEPPIKGFALMGPNMDSTNIVLKQPACVLLFCESLDTSTSSWMPGFKEVVSTAQSKNIPVYIATSAPVSEIAAVFVQNGLADIQIFTCDNTAIRTAARTNPCLYILRTGTVQEKYSFREIDNAAHDVKKM